MQAKADAVTQLMPGARPDLAHLSNAELLRQTRNLIGKSNQLFAALLVHLAEVEARGLHRTRACSSLYTYCIYELRFSEDAAARRASAAKLVRRFPAVLDAIARGELHLTGLLMLGPHLTDENHMDVLARAKFRTKKEIGKLVRRLSPLPQVPDRIEPLGPELPRAPRNPTWAEFVESLCPPVRELRPGERPADWANDTLESGAAVPCWPASLADKGLPADKALRPDGGLAEVTAEPLPPLDEPHLYQMQFTTTEEHAELVERAKALLSGPGAKTLGDLHLQAMRLLVAELEKRRFAVTKASNTKTSNTTASNTTAAVTKGHQERPQSDQHPRQRRQRGRHIPAALRRAVFQRDERRCAYIDERGQRCRETHRLELHHVQAFAKGGRHTLSNLALRCPAHNALAAEQDFGREQIAQARDSCRHESRRRAESG